MISPSLCLTPGCTRQASTCGVCQTCHTAAMRAIKRGLATRAELIEWGWILPPHRAATVTFAAALERKRMEQHNGIDADASAS